MNTYKVIKIEETLIYLGKDDGTLLKVEQTSFNFVPQLGDIVEVYKSEGTYIITKKSSEVPTEQKKEEKGPSGRMPSGAKTPQNHQHVSRTCRKTITDR